MQQTEKRGLNIIEPSDPFLPDALNDNTRKIEAALDAHEAAVKELTDDLDTRVKVFEAVKFAYGIFPFHSSTEETVELGFTPKILFVEHARSSPTVSRLITCEDEGSSQLRIVEGGFVLSTSNGINYYPGNYNFVAIG